MNGPGPDTKTLIRDQALSLFAARGYSAVSMRELAEAVGMRQGGLYNHFGSKQEILVDLMTRHMELLAEARDRAMAGVAGPVERLKAFARFHVAHHIDHPAQVFIAFMELRSLEPEAHARIVALRDGYEAGLRAILDEGVAAGLFRVADTAVHTRMLLSMLTGVTVWFHEGGRLGRDEVIACHVQAAVQSTGCDWEDAA